MKALSIREPWASLIVDGYKIVEIRFWSQSSITRAKALNGQIIAIHASKKFDHRATFDENPRQGKQFARWWPGSRDNPFNLGCVIGTAKLDGIVTYKSAAAFNQDRPLHLNPEMPESEDPQENFFAYKKREQSPLELVGLIFKNPKRIEPKEVKGRLGFFQVGILTPPFSP